MVTGEMRCNSTSYDMVQFRHKATGTKNSKCIDRVDIKVIDRRIKSRSNGQNEYESTFTIF